METTIVTQISDDMRVVRDDQGICLQTLFVDYDDPTGDGDEWVYVTVADYYEQGYRDGDIAGSFEGIISVLLDFIVNPPPGISH